MERETCYDGTLEGLFALLDRFWPAAGGPRQVRRLPGPFARRGPEAQGLLFDEGAPGDKPGPAPQGGTPQGGTPPSMPLLPDPAALGGAAGLLFQVSAGAYGALVYTWMSGLPLEAQALRYALKVLAAAREAALAAEPAGGASNAAPWYARGEARQGAERAAWNRGDDDCGAVLAAAYKVAHEIERLMGVLRFQPDARGRYVARCAPDHLVLPALAPHFTRRFGDTPWVVIDERRGLALAREGGAGPLLIAAGEIPGPQGGPEPRDRDPQGLDPWEKLWQSYHRTIAIENRKNLSLQRRFVPLRYRGYMSEFGPGPDQPPENCN